MGFSIYNMLTLFSYFLKLNVSGYNHKLRVLLDTVLKAMADFTVKPERFSVIKVIMEIYAAERSLY